MATEDHADAVEQWVILRKQYPELPSADEIEQEFDIRLQEPVIRSTLWIIIDHMMQAANHIEGIIQPQRMPDMIEHKFYTDQERKTLYKKYKEFIAKVHELWAAMFQTRKERIQALIKGYQYVKKTLKPFMHEFLHNQAEQWLKEDNLPEEKRESYMG